jgi:hypothetical protein
MLGMIPATSKLEKEENALIAEYEKLVNYTDSQELARFYELYERVNSGAFKQKRKEIESLRFKGSEEQAREVEFSKLKKSKDIVRFFKTASGNELKKFEETAKSKILASYDELEKFISSDDFKSKQKMKPVTFKDTAEYEKFKQYKKLRKDRDVKKKRDEEKVKLFEELRSFVDSAEFLKKKNMKPVTFRDTPEYQKLVEFNKLANSEEIISFFKFRKSKELANYLEVKDSSRLKRYYELEAYLKSGEFLTKKEFLTDKKRFEKTEMFKELSEYNVLKKSENINWYFDVKDSKKFDFIKARQITFREEFDGNKLDTGKWLTNYYWGEKVLKDRYSAYSDLQAYTASENFELQHGILRIITKPQKINGKLWNVEKGFTNKEFDFSSGLINTGDSFRQKYGIFEAKIKLTDPTVRNAFWLTGDKMTPHINICRSGHNKVWFDLFSSPKDGRKKSIGSRYLSDFFIYRLEWTAQSLIWKINGVEVMKLYSGVPQESMYISLAGGVDKPVNGLTSMEIDWVRAYQIKE